MHDSAMKQGMDGRYYHHYASVDRMWHMPKHPGPYPEPEEPASLEALSISPLELNMLLSSIPGEVRIQVEFQLSPALA